MDAGRAAKEAATARYREGKLDLALESLLEAHEHARVCSEQIPCTEVSLDEKKHGDIAAVAESSITGDLEELNYGIMCNLSAVTLELGHLEKSVQWAGRAISLQPCTARGYFRKAQALATSNSMAAAKSVVAQGLKRSPTDSQLLNMKSILHQPTHHADTPAAPCAVKPSQTSPPSCTPPLTPENPLKRRLGPTIPSTTTRQRSDSNTETHAIPVTVLSGFLGSGKTTLLKHILKANHGLRIAVLVNDMAELNIDAALIRRVLPGSHSESLPPSFERTDESAQRILDNTKESDKDRRHRGEEESSDRVVELTNGCICCSLKDELLEAVLALVGEGKWDYVLIESTGIGEPMPVAATLSSFNEREGATGPVVTIDTMVSVVDASMWLEHVSTSPISKSNELEEQHNMAHLLVEQVEFANVIVMNKVDLLQDTTAKEVEASLRILNPKAHIIPSTYCSIPVDQIMAANRFDLQHASEASGWAQELIGQGHASEVDVYGFTSFLYTASCPFHPERLLSLIDHMADTDTGKTSPSWTKGMLRSKGFIWVACLPDMVLEWSFAGKQLTLRPYGTWSDKCSKREQRVVFIGRGIDQQKIHESLSKCVLTSDEMAAGPSAWSPFVDLWLPKLNSAVDGLCIGQTL